MVRESELVLLTCTGHEIGVASTKAFTTQLTALAMLTVALAKNGAGECGSSWRRQTTVSARLRLRALIAG